jgi:hypothetical protein
MPDPSANAVNKARSALLPLLVASSLPCSRSASAAAPVSEEEVALAEEGTGGGGGIRKRAWSLVCVVRFCGCRWYEADEEVETVAAEATDAGDIEDADAVVAPEPDGECRVTLEGPRWECPEPEPQ